MSTMNIRCTFPALLSMFNLNEHGCDCTTDHHHSPRRHGPNGFHASHQSGPGHRRRYSIIGSSIKGKLNVAWPVLFMWLHLCSITVSYSQTMSPHSHSPIVPLPSRVGSKGNELLSNSLHSFPSSTFQLVPANCGHLSEPSISDMRPSDWQSPPPLPCPDRVNTTANMPKSATSSPIDSPPSTDRKTYPIAQSSTNRHSSSSLLVPNEFNSSWWPRHHQFSNEYFTPQSMLPLLCPLLRTATSSLQSTSSIERCLFAACLHHPTARTGCDNLVTNMRSLLLKLFPTEHEINHGTSGAEAAATSPTTQFAHRFARQTAAAANGTDSDHHNRFEYRPFSGHSKTPQRRTARSVATHLGRVLARDSSSRPSGDNDALVHTTRSMIRRRHLEKDFGISQHHHDHLLPLLSSAVFFFQKGFPN